MSDEELNQEPEQTNEEPLVSVDGLSKENNDYLSEIVDQSIEAEDDPFRDPDGKDEDEEEEEEQEPSPEDVKEQNRRNAERRIRNKKKREEEEQESEEEDEEQDEPEYLEDDQLDAEAARVYRERLDAAEKYIEDTRDIIETVQQLGVNKQQMEIGAQFAQKWTRDPIGTTKELLTFLESKGIDISQVYDHQVDNSQSRIDAEVNRRMQPILEQQRQEQAQRQARETLDTFLNNYPDAEEHLGEIVEVMRRGNFRNPYDAYDRLRRVYQKHGVDWFGREFEEPAPQPSVGTRARANVAIEPEPKTLHDLIVKNTNNYFNGD